MGRLILAVKPSRLPAPDRVRKDHGWESTLAPHLDPQATRHLDHPRPLVTRLGLFNRLGTASEDVFEKPPVRSTAQEVFAHGHESGQIDYGVRSEMVELSPKEVQKTPEDRMGAVRIRDLREW